MHKVWPAGQFVARQGAKKTVAAPIRMTFNAPDRAETCRLVRAALDAWYTEHPKLAHRAGEAIPENLTVFDFPAAYGLWLRISHGLERINRELRRRTQVASIFPNPESCLRLVCVLLAELDDEWLTGRVYLNLNP